MYIVHRLIKKSCWAPSTREALRKFVSYWGHTCVGLPFRCKERWGQTRKAYLVTCARGEVAGEKKGNVREGGGGGVVQRL